jgi:hypothetical protein
MKVFEKKEPENFSIQEFVFLNDINELNEPENDEPQQDIEFIDQKLINILYSQEVKLDQIMSDELSVPKPVDVTDEEEEIIDADT